MVTPKEPTTEGAPRRTQIVPVRLVRKPLTKKQWIIGIVVALLLAVAIGIGIKWVSTAGSPSAYIDTGKYQAVYLTDGSVYFGKLQLLNEGSARLTDVYYPPKTSAQETAKNPEESSTLVKFGTELLGGEDQIVFNKTQIAYWLNLKSDSKVTKAINEFKK